MQWHKIFRLFLIFSHSGSITDPKNAQEREQLREKIAAVVGVSANAIKRLTMRIKDDLPISLLANADDEEMVTD